LCQNTSQQEVDANEVEAATLAWGEPGNIISPLFTTALDEDGDVKKGWAPS
jgi:hypothetical protein